MTVYLFCFLDAGTGWTKNEPTEDDLYLIDQGELTITKIESVSFPLLGFLGTGLGLSEIFELDLKTVEDSTIESSKYHWPKENA